jgi:predicted GNAT family N-acyltransferase
MELRFISIDDPRYADELELRYRVLREPLGHMRADVPFPFEHESLHLIALNDDGSVVGCVLFHPETPESGRLFQMAVVPALQRTGLGRRMVSALENELGRRGVAEVHLHARENVVPFYERLGYSAFGEPFMEVSISHRHMHKKLDVTLD